MLSDIALKELEERYAREEKRYSLFSSSLVTLVRNLCTAAGLEVEFVYGRAKTLRSLMDKVKRKNYEGLDDVPDKCGVRIVTQYQSTVDEVRHLLAREFEIIETVEHGNEGEDVFGYSSLHLLIRLTPARSCLLEWEHFENLVAEIQIRSVVQHAWAIISRSLDYNAVEAARRPIRRRLFRVAALLEQADQEFDAYRSDVASVRHFDKLTEPTDWHGQPLDYASLAAVWNSVPWRQLDEAALTAGWREPSVRRNYSHIEETPSDRERALRLLDIARSGGAFEIADIFELARSADTHISRLRLIRVSAERAGYIPFAIGPDVAAILLVCLNGEPAALAARRTEYSMLPQLVSAALDCGDEPESDLGASGSGTGDLSVDQIQIHDEQKVNPKQPHSPDTSY